MQRYLNFIFLKPKVGMVRKVWLKDFNRKPCILDLDDFAGMCSYVSGRGIQHITWSEYNDEHYKRINYIVRDRLKRVLLATGNPLHLTPHEKSVGVTAI